MAWLDDRLRDHPKMLAASDRAFRYWALALCYCNAHHTAGHLEGAVVALSVPSKIIDELVRLRLWDLDVDGLWVHDWQEHNQQRDDAAELRRSQAAERQRRHRDKVRASRNRNADQRDTVTPDQRDTSRPESVTAPRGGAPTPTRASARTPAKARQGKALPSSSTRPDPTTALVTAANTAAAARHELEQLGIDPGLADPDPALALEWAKLARTEATTNPAGYVVAGIRSGIRPTSRTDAGGPDTPRLDPVDRRRRWVEDYGWRMEPDLADAQLEDLGANLDERVALLEYAAELNAQHTAHT